MRRSKLADGAYPIVTSQQAPNLNGSFRDTFSDSWRNKRNNIFCGCHDTLMTDS